MAFFRVLLLMVAAFAVTACGSPSKFKKYDGPEVTQIQVHKADRKMYLLHNDKVLKEYNVRLGFAPTGHKQFEGDALHGHYLVNQSCISFGIPLHSNRPFLHQSPHHLNVYLQQLP